MSVARLTVDWVYRASESGAGWTATRRTRGAHAGADAAPHGLTRMHGAELDADVDGGEGSGALDPRVPANGGSPARVGGTSV